MKHSSNHRHHGYGAEWLQAIFTLMVLSWIATSVDNFDSYGTTYANNPTPKTVSGTYWNETIGYWFRWNSGDTYKSHGGSGVDIVAVSPKDGLVYEDSQVKVSFYTKDSIQEIEKHTLKILLVHILVFLMELLLLNEISLLLRQRPFLQHFILNSRPSSPFSPKRLDSLGSFLFERSCENILFSYTYSALHLNTLGDDIGFEEKNRMLYVLYWGSSPRYQRGKTDANTSNTRGGSLAAFARATAAKLSFAPTVLA